ncbi:hypothetical protein N9578_01355 [bacterium]|nr:hypothetical protein [bacterium]
MNERIACILTASLDNRRLISDDSKLHSIVHPAPYIRSVLPREDFDIFIQLNYTGELNQSKQDQIDFLRDTYNPVGIEVIHCDVLQEEIDDHILAYGDGVTDVVHCNRYNNHFPQHWGFFRVCERLIDQGYTHYFKLRPDVYPSPDYDILSAIRTINRIGPESGRMWCTEVNICSNSVRSLHVNDISMCWDQASLEKILPNIPQWLNSCYQDIVRIRDHPQQYSADIPYTIVEGSVGKLIQLNHVAVSVEPRRLRGVLYRPVHGEAASPPLMSWDFFQSLEELLRGHQW